ncbi:hypothetical protein D1157_17290 [Anaerotruncus sp. X29]|nr:hypothetical protein [Anaerotruncus sp. X29]
MLFWVPDQNNALRFSGFQPEARLRATLGQDAPYGRGGSAPSPYAPPRQAGKPGPIGHCVVGSKATEVWIPDQTSGAQAPYFGGLLGPAVRSAAKAATPPQFALRARGQCPLPVCPSPASWEARPDRALCNGVLRRGPGRVGGACLDKKQVGAGTDMRVFSTQPKAGTLPGDT